mgnify:CR=1 FL=1
MTDAVDFDAALWRPDARGAATFITLPFDVKAIFGRARCPVRVTINDHTWRTTTQVKMASTSPQRMIEPSRAAQAVATSKGNGVALERWLAT